MDQPPRKNLGAPKKNDRICGMIGFCQRCHWELPPKIPGPGRCRKWCARCAVIEKKRSMNRSSNAAKARRYREDPVFRGLMLERRRLRDVRAKADLCRWEDDGGVVIPSKDVGPLERRCSQCCEVKPLGWFVKNGSGTLTSACRICRKARRSRSRYLRRARIKGADRIRGLDIRAIGERQNWRCACGCGVVIRYEYHIDHKIPIAKGGEHTLRNLQLMNPLCNLRKGTKMPIF